MLLLASTNAGKAREVQRFLPDMQVQTPHDRGLNFSYEECGTTFLENALGKARHLFGLTGAATVADDSGLMVKALRGAPGVHSARYGGDIDTNGRNLLLLETMAKTSDRSAQFVCCLAVILDTDRLVVIQETVEGTIVHSPRGSGGFGYDPIFQPRGADQTFAEMEGAAKDAISHRGRALQKLRRVLPGSMTDAHWVPG